MIFFAQNGFHILYEISRKTYQIPLFIRFNAFDRLFRIIFPTLERKYQCLGQWTENNIIYTYAKRLDIPVYECFLGALASTEEIFIKEAGEHCRRDIDPYRYSMQLNKTRACPQVQMKMDLSPIVAHDTASTASSPASPVAYETTPANNGEVEYEYYEENHANINGNGNVVSSTGLVPHAPKDGATVTEPQNANSEKINYELFHPNGHPKLDAGTTVKIDSKNTAQNRSYSQHCCVHFLLLNSLLLALLLPLFNR